MLLPRGTRYGSSRTNVGLTTLLLVLSILTSFTSACNSDQSLFRLNLKFDKQPNEVKWVLKKGVVEWNENAETVMERDFGYYANQKKAKESVCLERNDNYVIRIFDQGGDGICCSNGKGKYVILLKNPKMKKKGNGKFGAYEDFAFSTGTAPTQPSPTQPSPTQQSPTQPSPTSGSTLKDAAPPGLVVGGVLHGYNPEWKIGEYKDVAASEFNAITSTIFMGLNGFGEDWFTYAPFNEVVDFATSRGMLVHGHALVFPAANTPYWDDNPGADVEDTLREFITDTVKVRKGDVFVWDVVNEVFGYPGWDGNTVDEYSLRTDYREYQALGRDYIRKSFEFARDADPDAVLILNEANAEELDDRSDLIFDYMKELKEDGVPIDGIGFQMHVFERKNIASVRANFQRFQDEGFQIFITEMDVMTKGFKKPNKTPPKGQVRKQAASYKEIVELAVDLPAVKSLLLWDFADDRSWMHPSSFQLGNKPVGTYFFPTPWADGGVDGKPMVKKPLVYDAIRDGLLSGGGPSPTTAPAPNPTQAPVPTDNSGTYKRISSQFDPPNGYLTRGSYFDSGNWLPSTDLDLVTLDSSTEGWVSIHWKLLDAGNGMYRIVCGWGEDTGYLTRDGAYDSNTDSWLPDSTLSLYTLEEGWYSQLWILEYKDSNFFYLINQWGDDTGYLTSLGTSVAFSSEKGTSDQYWTFSEI